MSTEATVWLLRKHTSKHIHTDCLSFGLGNSCILWFETEKGRKELVIKYELG